MIRSFKSSDTEQVMRLWLEGNLDAHRFIESSYWTDNYDSVRRALSEAELYIYEEEARPVAFVGISGGHIEGLFVDKAFRSRGIGHRLIGFLKDKYSFLSLSVYKNNSRALSFYLREGFSIAESGIDKATGEIEFSLTFSLSDDWERLYAAACSVRGERELSDTIEAGGVAAAVMSNSGNIYTGVCVDTACSLGMCAERNAIAHMITCGESRIQKVAAVMADGRCGYPCGACLEMMTQLCEEGGAEILISYPEKKTVKLKELLPFWWKTN